MLSRISSRIVLAWLSTPNGRKCQNVTTSPFIKLKKYTIHAATGALTGRSRGHLWYRVGKFLGGPDF